MNAASRNQEPTLEQIAAAREAVDGRTPAAVVEAFLPKPRTILGTRLVPLRAGHELVLSQLGHPLATGAKWEDVDVLTALFVFSRSSRELFSLIERDAFQSEFLAFVDEIPVSDIAKLGEEMVAHWMRARATALAMESRHGAQKKTADSAGSSPPSPPRARCMAGIRKWFSTIFPSPRFSR